jgi:hypothetical protein
VLVVNGTAVDVVTTLASAANAIRELDYTVTVPTGSLIGQTTLSVGIGFPESVTYIFSATQPPGTMRIDTSVVAAGSAAPFPTSVQATALLAGGAASGLSSATITIELTGMTML